ncbi:hypothetical protein ACFL5Q_08230 [Planctomycetota bacterium]
MSNGNGDSSGLAGYEEKSAEFIGMLKERAAGDVVVIATPHALGDTYEEIIESLNRLADAEVHLAIVPRKERK